MNNNMPAKENHQSALKKQIPDFVFKSLILMILFSSLIAVIPQQTIDKDFFTTIIKLLNALFVSTAISFLIHTVCNKRAEQGKNGFLKDVKLSMFPLIMMNFVVLIVLTLLGLF